MHDAGVDFDGKVGAGHVRLSFAGNIEDVTEGLERLASHLR